MNQISIQGIHYHLSETTEAYIREKLEKFSYLSDRIVDGILRVIHEKDQYTVEIDVHFNYGTKLHLHAAHSQLYPAVENLMDKLKVAASDEKKKIKDYHNHHAPRAKDQLAGGDETP